MLISYKWIQSYFEKELPSPEELAALLTMHIFEVENIEKKTSIDGQYEDVIFDVKVLPDRAPYCLSHRYMAQEIGALIRQDIKWPDIFEVNEKETSRSLEVLIDGNAQKNAEHHSAKKAPCARYIGRLAENIAATPSPAWLRHQLEVLGQRSINSIVDLTNYVMLETGQPMHAFDADKVEGDIVVRFAKAGIKTGENANENTSEDGHEEIVLLDGSTVKLNSSMLVIADELGPLAIAGIKGGKRAEVTSETQNIVIEAACFDRTSTRRTSQAVGIRNESSKRFENGVTPERAGLAVAMFTGHLAKLNPDAVIGESVDVYPHVEEPVVIEIKIADIFNRLGVEVPRDKMVDILTRLGLEIEEAAHTLKLGIPSYRPDLRIAEDIAEEVGRVYGYDKISERIPAPRHDRKINKNFYYFNCVRKALAGYGESGSSGFSEVYTYSLVDKGDMAVQNPLTVERSHMRNSITDLFPSKFLFNMKNADLLGVKEIRIFELGKIFGGKIERNALAFGIARSKFVKSKDGADPQAAAKAELASIVEHLVKNMTAISGGQTVPEIPAITFVEIKGDAQTACAGFVAEIELDQLIAALPDPEKDTDLSAFCQSTHDGRKYKAISQYPSSARDIAVFVPGENENGAQKVSDIIMQALGDKKNIVARLDLFDSFVKRKEGEPVRTSYAYRLVFQASDRTLRQEEVEELMSVISNALNAQDGWEVR